MPNRPLRPCGQPGCPELVSGGYCDKHKKQVRQYTSREVQLQNAVMEVDGSEPGKDI
jgi:hypothetical protein